MKKPCFYECGEDDCNCEEERRASEECNANCCHIRLAIGIVVLLAVVVVGILRHRK